MFRFKIVKKKPKNLRHTNMPTTKLSIVLPKLVTLLLVINQASACPSECRCFGFNGEWVIDCSTKNISAFPMGLPVNSTEIFLQNNMVGPLPDSSFQNMANLRFLYLHKNNITRLQSAVFGDALSLKYLTLHDNIISTLANNTFRGMSELIVLNLNSNKLTKLPAGLLKDAVKLVQVSFADNLLTSIDYNMFDGLSKLKYIGLSDNHLISLPENLGELAPDLYFIDYSGNNLETMPPIPNTTHQIYAERNLFKNLTPASFANAATLYEVFVGDNQISSIHNDTFMGATSLGWLNLKGNNIEEVDDNMFDHLPKLQGLYLEANKPLKTISKNAFLGFKDTIYRLSIDDCSLTWLDSSILSSLNNENLVIWMGGNPWNCDCNLKNLSNFVADHSGTFYDIDMITCSQPTVEAGQRIDKATITTCTQSGPGYNQLALIISVSIIAALFLVAMLIFLVRTRRSKSSRSIVVTDSQELAAAL